MLYTALVSFMIAFFAQAIDPTAEAVPIFAGIGIAAAVLCTLGLVLALVMEHSHKPIFGHHAHSHA